MKIVFYIFSIILFSSCSNEEDSALINKWKVNGYLKNNNSISQTAPSDLYITFNKDKTISTSLEINSCSSTFDVGEKDLTINDFACTEACCDSDFSMEFVSLLSLVKAYNTSGSQLNLTGDNQMVIRLDLAQ